MLRIKRRGLNLSIIAFLVLVLFFTYGIALAEESGHQTTNAAASANGGGESMEGGHVKVDRSADLLDLLYRFINFALLVIILFVVIKKTPVKNLLSESSEEIRQKMRDLQTEREEAERNYKDVEKRLKDFEITRGGIIERFRKEGLAEKDRIISEAKERVKHIIDQAELTIQQEIRYAKEGLRREMVDLSAEKAKEIISKEINDKDQEQLVSDFIERVDKLH